MGPVEDHVANLVVAQLLFLESENPDKDIHFYINSPGGAVTAGLAIYDTHAFHPAGCKYDVHRSSRQYGGVAARLEVPRENVFVFHTRA